MAIVRVVRTTGLALLVGLALAHGVRAQGWPKQAWDSCLGTHPGIDSCTSFIDSGYDSGNTLNLRSSAYMKRGEGYLERAEIPHLAKSGDLDRAIRDLSMSMTLMSQSNLGADREIQRAYVARSRTFGLKGDVKGAIRDMTRVIEINDKYPACYEIRGFYHLRNQSIDLAIKDFTEHIARNPHSASAFAGRAEAFLRKRQYEQAHDDVEDALKANAKDERVQRLALELKKYPRQTERKPDEPKAITVDLGTLQARSQAAIRAVVPHTGPIYSIVSSSDGTYVVSGGADRTIKVWEPQTGRLIRTITGHAGPVRAVALSPEGMNVLSGSEDKTMKLWDVGSGSLLRSFDLHENTIVSVAFAPDGKTVASASQDDTVKLWAAATGRLLRTFDMKARHYYGAVRTVAFSPDGRQLLIGVYEKAVLFNISNGELERTFEHGSTVNSVVFSSDGIFILTGTLNRSVGLWDKVTGQLIHRMEGHLGQVESVAFSPDGAQILSGSEDKTLKLWDTQTGRLLHSFSGHSGPVASVTFLPNGKQAVSSSAYLTFDDDSGDNIKLWDTVSGQLIQTIGDRPPRPKSVAVSRQGTDIVWGNRDGTLGVWDLTAGTLRSFHGHTERGVNSVAMAPTGHTFLSAGEDHLIKLWSVSDVQKPVRTFAGHTHKVTSVTFTQDGTRALSVGWDAVMMWDVTSGRTIWSTKVNELGASIPDCIAVSSDNRWVLISGGKENEALKLIDGNTGKLMRSLASNEPRWSVAFSPDGKTIVSGGWTIEFFDVQTGKMLRRYEGHSGRIDSVAFSPDGKRVVSGGGDSKVKVWEVGTGRLLHLLDAHTGRVNSVAFSLDGKRIISASADSTIRIWDSQTGQLITTTVVGRNGEWLVVTSEGFFSARPAGAQIVSVVRGVDVTFIDQVHQSLFNPDLVREALGGDLDREVARAAKTMNLEKVLDSAPAPTVEMRSRAEGTTSIHDVVTVTARVTDQGKGVGRIEWRVNGVTAAVTSKLQGSRGAHAVSQELALDPGDNIIEVVAYNATNLLASVPARITIKFSGTADQINPRLHILAIGINKYVDQGWSPPGSSQVLSFAPLVLAAKDAGSVAGDLKAAAVGQYADVSVTLALDEDASRDNLERIINKLSAEVHQRDTFVFFAAAHGISHNGRFYLIPQDYSGGTNPISLEANAIDQVRLQDWLANRIKAKKAVILLDTCESGALVAGHLRSRTDNAASEAAVGRLHEATGRPVLTAAALGQFAYEGLIGRSGNRHGLFTYAVLDALRSGDTNGNGLIELLELVAHVQKLVPKLAAELGGTGRSAFALPRPPGVEQSARFGSRGEDFTLVNRLR